MKISCSGCGAEYKVDPSRIQGDKAWFTCKKCPETIIFEKKDLLEPVYPAAENDFLAEDLSQSVEHQEMGHEIFATSDPALEPSAPDAESETQAPFLVPAKNYRFGLTPKVILLMLIVSLVPGSIYFALSSKSAHDRIISESTRNGTMLSRLLASQVDEWIDKNVRALKTVASLSAVQSMDMQSQEDILKTLQKKYPWMYLVFTTDINGLNIARSDQNNLKNYGDRQYVKDIINGSQLAWQTLIGKTSNKPALVLAVPITHQGRTIGLLAAAMTRDDLSERVTGFKLGRTGSSFLVDQTGKTVAHQNNSFVLKQLDMSAHPLVAASRKGGQGRLEFIDADGKTAIGFTSSTTLGWVLAIQQDKKEALEPLEKARFSALMVLGGTLILVLLISIVAGRALVKPIKELTEAADRISIGDMDVEITTRSKDEIGDLAEAVTRLQDSIRISISRLKRLRK